MNEADVRPAQPGFIIYFDTYLRSEDSVVLRRSGTVFVSLSDIKRWPEFVAQHQFQHWMPANSEISWGMS